MLAFEKRLSYNLRFFGAEFLMGKRKEAVARCLLLGALSKSGTSNSGTHSTRLFSNITKLVNLHNNDPTNDKSILNMSPTSTLFVTDFHPTISATTLARDFEHLHSSITVLSCQIIRSESNMFKEKKLLRLWNWLNCLHQSLLYTSLLCRIFLRCNWARETVY
jgi:hypothetical protein